MRAQSRSNSARELKLNRARHCRQFDPTMFPVKLILNMHSWNGVLVQLKMNGEACALNPINARVIRALEVH